MNRINICPDKAFILAAGRGTRLRPHTDTLPKPLVPVDGRAIIDHVIDKLAADGIGDITVNLHYMADKLAQHLDARMQKDPAVRFHFSPEQELMDTGGGVRQGLRFMGEGAFFVVSGDSFWRDGPGGSALQRMAAAWDPARMDLLLLLQPREKVVGTHKIGDYHVDEDGRATRALDRNGAYMWTSVRMCDAQLFADTPDTPFSFLELMDRAQARGRLYAIIHDGDWFHITSPEDLTAIDAALLPDYA